MMSIPTHRAHVCTQPLDPKQQHPDAIGVRLCINCAHARQPKPGRPVVCWHPKLGFSLVDGSPHHAPSHEVRHPRIPSERDCGEEGRWFSPLAAPVAQENACTAYRTDTEIVERTETAARYLAHWRWGAMPEHEGQTTRNSANAKLNAAWLAACHLQEIMTDSDAVNAAQVVDDVATQEDGAA